uniref:Uncharacterized protein n=1 Tax=Lepeophtheirus salmonis TaxID=72036 RepID=A0A0K2U0Q9_LEPSM
MPIIGILLLVKALLHFQRSASTLTYILLRDLILLIDNKCYTIKSVFFEKPCCIRTNNKLE